MADIGSLVAKIGLNSSDFDRGIKGVTHDLNKLPGATGGASAGFSALGAMAAGAVGGIAAAAVSKVTDLVVGLGKSAMDTAVQFTSWGVGLAAEMETAATNFEVMLGSAENAQRMIADLRSFAASTPFEFAGLQDATQNLINFGVAQKDVIPTLRVLGDLSLGNAQKMKDLALIYGQAKTTGEVHWDDVRQFAQRGVDVISQFAKQMGVSNAEVKKLVADGEIGFGNLHNALIALTEEGSKFGGGMAKAAQTMQGKYSTLQDSIAGLAMEFGQSLAEAFDFGKGMDAITGLVEAIKTQGIPAFKGFLEIAKIGFFVVADWVKMITVSILETVSNGLTQLKGFIDKIAPYIERFVQAHAGIAKLVGKGDLAKSLATFKIDTSDLGLTADITGRMADVGRKNSTQDLIKNALDTFARFSPTGMNADPLAKANTGNFFSKLLDPSALFGSGKDKGLIGKLGDSITDTLGSAFDKTRGVFRRITGDVDWSAFGKQKTQKELPGATAVEAGSAEYYSAIFRSMRGEGASVQEKQLKELEKIAKAIVGMADRKDTGGRIPIVTDLLAYGGFGS